MGLSNATLFLLFISVICLHFVIVESATCPHSDTTLVAWSSVARLNTENAAIVIAANERFLLDKSPGVLLESILINGEIVVANANIELDVGWIKVNAGGKFTAGSASCRITNKVILTFHGDRTDATNIIPEDDFDGVAFGSKGFVVATEGSLEIYGANSGPVWARLTKTANINDTVIYLDQDVKWKVGDTIVVTSTDFGELLTGFNASYTSLNWARGSLASPDQSENVTIKSISARTITLSRPLNYTHWGDGVQRAEVGLLTHNIVFRGDNKSDEFEFGGHLIMRKAKKIHIEGVEFTKFGQRGVLGRYPVHFHVQREVIGMEFTLTHSSIHNNYQRCLVIHESHGVVVEDVVGYRTLGHMFFLEDGGERMNTLNRVLGISARGVDKLEVKYGKKIQIIPTDSDPSIFWVTNMNNTITNCVAVGAKFGFWMLMPKAVTGPSNVLYPTDYNPRRVPVGEFRDNVAHSIVDTGFEFDNYLTAEGTTEEASYSPTGGMPVFSGLIAYKCRQFGVWGKSSMEFFGLTLMDNRRSLMVNGGTIIHDSLFVGESDNIGRPIRKEHSRGFPDTNGANTSKVCGHESYDNGGPQYSYNNIFVNFVSTATRKVGALCPLQTGPFMLDTKNRVFNLTFVNSNRVHVGSPRSGDNEYGWTILDTDGSVTKREGGGWIVSQNASHLLPSGCTYEEDWEAWNCPPFDLGYVQLLITSQITSSAPVIALNGTNVASAAITNFRNTRAIFYEMGATGRLGKVLGANINCANGTEDACFQFMHNVMPRKFYTIRFVLNDIFIQTPKTLAVNMHSANPGDYLFVAIPYPVDAQPFNITYGNVICSPVTNINDVNITTYYYDANSQHLYLRTKVTITQANAVVRNHNLTDYGNSASNYLIQTSCEQCAPTESKLKVIPNPPTLTLKEESYQADLKTCQVVGTKQATTGTGSAFFWFYPSTQELHYNVYHNLPLNVAQSVVLGVGKPGTEEYTIASKNFRHSTSPLRGIMTLSASQWADLVKGNIFIEVRSVAYPDGHLRGQVLCKASTCSLPPAIATVDACAPVRAYYSIFDNTAVDFTEAFGNDNTTKVYSPDALCGNVSVQLNIKSGYYLLNVNSRKFLTVGTTYKYLEFFVKVLPGSGEFPLYVSLYNSSSNYRLRVTTAHVNNYLIDEYFNWTRIYIPLSDFVTLPDVYNLTRIQFALVDTSARRDILIDEIRVVAGYTAPTTQLAVSSDIVKYYEVPCVSTGGTGTGTGTGSGSGSGSGSGNGSGSESEIPEDENSIASVSSVCLFLGVVATIFALL